jgi:NADH:ubiquinone oxidoreductase subunit 5 (subunit L)/multisubunit Na+/H+ antiporter MnhA subunit
MSGEQDLKKIGGIQHKIPVTYALSVITTVCLMAEGGLLSIISPEFLLNGRGAIAALIYITFSAINTLYYLRFLYATFKEESHSGEHVSAYIKESNFWRQIPVALCLVMGCCVIGFLCAQKDVILFISKNIIGRYTAINTIFLALLLFFIYCVFRENYLQKSIIIRTYTVLKAYFQKALHNALQQKDRLVNALPHKFFPRKFITLSGGSGKYGKLDGGYGIYVSTFVLPKLYKIEKLFSEDINENIKGLFVMLVLILFILCFIK